MKEETALHDVKYDTDKLFIKYQVQNSMSNAAEIICLKYCINDE